MYTHVQYHFFGTVVSSDCCWTLAWNFWSFHVLSKNWDCPLQVLISKETQRVNQRVSETWQPVTCRLLSGPGTLKWHHAQKQPTITIQFFRAYVMNIQLPNFKPNQFCATLVCFFSVAPWVPQSLHLCRSTAGEHPGHVNPEVMWRCLLFPSDSMVQGSQVWHSRYKLVLAQGGTKKDDIPLKKYCRASSTKFPWFCWVAHAPATKMQSFSQNVTVAFGWFSSLAGCPCDLSRAVSQNDRIYIHNDPLSLDQLCDRLLLLYILYYLPCNNYEFSKLTCINYTIIYSNQCDSTDFISQLSGPEAKRNIAGRATWTWGSLKFAAARGQCIHSNNIHYSNILYMFKFSSNWI